MTNNERKLIDFLCMAENLISLAEEAGVVVTIATVPKTPLAMGNHEMVSHVRIARVMAVQSAVEDEE